jgi:DUF177 domain-containing protein
MFINVQDLEFRPVEFDQVFQPGEVDHGPDLRQLTPLTCTGRAELMREHQGGKQSIDDIRMRGSFSTSVEVCCARCLEPVVHEAARDFDLLYRPLGVDAGRDELSITGAEAEIGYYTGDGLLLEDLLREQILLAVPMKSVCREDCKGLCPQCGRNLNFESCSCVPHADARWGSLKEIRDKLKS